MSAAASPNPNNILLLLVVGVGAYWFMTRRAVAMPYATQQQPSRSAQNAATAGALLNTGLRALGGLFGGSSGGQANPVYFDGLTNDMPRIDGVVVNPANGSAFDWWATNGTGGD